MSCSSGYCTKKLKDALNSIFNPSAEDLALSIYLYYILYYIVYQLLLATSVLQNVSIATSV